MFEGSSIIVVFIIVPALIIVSIMFAYKQIFMKKSTRIIRTLYIIALTCIASLSTVHTHFFEVILIIIAGVLGIIGSILNKIKNTNDELGDFLILVSIFANIILTFICI